MAASPAPATRLTTSTKRAWRLAPRRSSSDPDARLASSASAVTWLRLRGKENEIELYALAAAVSATSAGDEITALSSRLG